MKYRTKCVDCKKSIPVPTWKRCQECGDIHKKKVRTARYKNNKEYYKAKFKEWRERRNIIKKENDELLASLYKEMWGV